jgi:hypothetical protein
LTSRVRTLEDGFRIQRIDCKCGTYIEITHEDVVYHYCTCGKRYFNRAYYYTDHLRVVHRNKYYQKTKMRKIAEQKEREEEDKKNPYLSLRDP